MRQEKVIAVEIDRALIPILEDTLDGYDNVRVINEDVLKVDIRKLVEEENEGTDQSCCKSALLYYYADHYGLFENHVPIKSITVMVQKEVADRMQVGPGTKDYGALSLRCSIMPNRILGKCSAQLFYAQTESRVGGDTFRKARTSACRSAG